jgi:hypothetical protein
LRKACPFSFAGDVISASEYSVPFDHDLMPMSRVHVGRTMVILTSEYELFPRRLSSARFTISVALNVCAPVFAASSKQKTNKKYFIVFITKL